MNSDQLVQQVLSAIKQQNWLLLCVLAGVAVASFSGALLQLWFAAKIKASVENKQHFDRLRSEHEFRFYLDLSRMLCSCYEKSWLRFTWRSNDSDAEIKAKGLKQALKDLSEAIQDNRASCPNELKADVQKFMELCAKLVRTCEDIQANLGGLEIRKQLEDVQIEVGKQYSKIEKTIKSNLDTLSGR